MELFCVESILVSVLFVIVSSLIFVKNKSPSAAPLPPGPRGLPILGFLPFLQPNLHLQFTSLAAKYGPIFHLRVGPKIWVGVTSPDLIKEVVRDHDLVFANHPVSQASFVATGGLDIVNSPYGPYWAKLRKVFVREMLSNKNLEASSFLRKEEVRRSVGNVHASIGTAIDVGKLIFVTELKVIMSLLWGVTVKGDEEGDRIADEFRDKVGEFVELLGKPNVSDFFPILARFDLQGVARDMRGVMPSVDGILDSMITARMESMDGDGSGDKTTKDFIQILLDLKAGGEKAMGLPQIKALLMDIVIGGTDTSATIVEWVMAELLNSPQEMKKVQQELNEQVGLDNVVEESHIPKLKYMEAVMKETFRLHPPLPLILPRENKQSTVVGGYTIPKDSKVFLNVWANYRDPRFWESPLEFKPDRFLEGGSAAAKGDYTGNNFQYLPFGSGRRVCPGLPLAERMIMYLLATLLHSFDWKLPEGENKVDFSAKFGLVMKKTTPLLAIPSQRLHHLSCYE